MSRSAISWTERTWEPVVGCSRVSPGCTHCFAERLVGTRMRHLPWADGLTRPDAHGSPRWTGEVRLREEVLAAPLHWRKPAHIFVCSRSDLFHESVPDEYIAAVFGIMAACPQHTFQVLTKRAARMRRWFEWASTIRYGHLPDEAGPVPVFQGWALERMDGTRMIGSRLQWPLPNVWLGVTAEDQQRADERIPEMLATPAAVRFVSVEPMIGAVDLSRWLWADLGAKGRARLNALHWVIPGGESGPGARPCDVAWIRDVVRQCREAGVPAFVKQLGARPTLATRTPADEGFSNVALGGLHRTGCLHLDDRKGSCPSEWPADLRMREWPEVARG